MFKKVVVVGAVAYGTYKILQKTGALNKVAEAATVVAGAGLAKINQFLGPQGPEGALADAKERLTGIRDEVQSRVDEFVGQLLGADELFGATDASTKKGNAND